MFFSPLPLPAFATPLNLVLPSSRARHTSSLKHSLPFLCILALHRLSSRFNQTGQKHQGAHDIAHTFFPTHNHILWIFVLATYLDVLQRLIRRGFPHSPFPIKVGTSLTLCLAALGFKLSFVHADAPELLRGITLPTLINAFLEWGSQSDQLVLQARTVFLGILAAGAYGLLCIIYLSPSRLNQKTRSPTSSSTAYLVHYLLTLFLITQTRLTSIPLFLLFETQLKLLLHSSSTSRHLTIPEIGITSLLMQYTAFYALGGSNAISSVDLSSAYNGVSGYNVLAVGVLTFVSNWAGAMWWGVSGTALLLLPLCEKQHAGQGKARSVWISYVAVQTVFVTVGLVGVMAACTLLRQHLFIWTVFSPKYLYAMAWGVAMHLGVNVGVSGILFWFLARG